MANQNSCSEVVIDRVRRGLAIDATAQISDILGSASRLIAAGDVADVAAAQALIARVETLTNVIVGVLDDDCGDDTASIYRTVHGTAMPEEPSHV